MAGGQNRSFKKDTERVSDARETLIALATDMFPSKMLLVDVVVGVKDFSKKAIFVYAIQDTPGVHQYPVEMYGTDLDELRHIVKFLIDRVLPGAA